MCHLNINAKDNKTNDTFSNNCHKNVHPFQRILHWNEDYCYQNANHQRRNKLTDEQPGTLPEGHPVHLPITLYEVDGERHYNATCHCCQRSEMEDAEQDACHVERGRKHSAHKQTPCITCRLKDGAG